MAAAAAASGGATVQVCPGAWPLNLVVGGDLVVEGLGAPEEVVLDGGGRDRVLRTLGGRLTLRSVTVTGGAAGSAQGAQGGAGVLAEYASVDFEDVVFTDNHAPDRTGGAFAVVGAGDTARMRRVRTEGNTAEVAAGGYLAEVGLDIEDLEATRNVAEQGIGGVWIVGSGTVTRLTASYNTGAGGAGGFQAEADDDAADDLVFYDLVVVGNQGLQGGGGKLVAGDYRSVELVGGEVAGNHADREGGGLELQGGDAWGLVAVREVEVRGNDADGGGGLRVEGDDGGVVVEGGIIEGNSGRTGGGVHADGLRLEGVEVRGNVALETGGGLLVEGDTLLLGGSVVDNRAAQGGGAWLQRDTLTLDAVGWSANSPDDVAAADLTITFGDAPVTTTCTAEGCQSGGG